MRQVFELQKCLERRHSRHRVRSRLWHVLARILSSQATKETKPEVPYGTLDLMILKTLAGMSPLRGYGIARRV